MLFSGSYSTYIILPAISSALLTGLQFRAARSLLHQLQCLLAGEVAADSVYETLGIFRGDAFLFLRRFAVDLHVGQVAHNLKNLAQLVSRVFLQLLVDEVQEALLTDRPSVFL